MSRRLPLLSVNCCQFSCWCTNTASRNLSPAYAPSPISGSWRWSTVFRLFMTGIVALWQICSSRSTPAPTPNHGLEVKGVKCHQFHGCGPIFIYVAWKPFDRTQAACATTYVHLLSAYSFRGPIAKKQIMQITLADCSFALTRSISLGLARPIVVPLLGSNLVPQHVHPWGPRCWQSWG